MKKTMIDIAGSSAAVYIIEDGGDFIISIPHINFSLACPAGLPPDARSETIVMHLFSMMDEDEAERIAAAVTQATAKQ